MTRAQKVRAFVAAFVLIMCAVLSVLFLGDLFDDAGSVAAPSEPPHATAPDASTTSTTSTTEEPVTTTTTEPPAPPVQQAPQSAPFVVREPPADVWDQLAQCESGGNWDTNTGNGYFGGLQIASPDAIGMTREQQIEWAIQIQARQGWGAWPACSARLGLR